MENTVYSFLAIAMAFLLSAGPSTLLAQGFCPTNLLINGSFEIGIGGPGSTTFVLGQGAWQGSGTAAYDASCKQAPEGNAYAYTNTELYQTRSTVTGDVFSLDFCSGFSEGGGTKTVTLQFYNGGTPLGSPIVHTITKDLNECFAGGVAWGRPYNLTSGAAPTNATDIRVSINGDPRQTGLAALFVTARQQYAALRAW